MPEHSKAWAYDGLDRAINVYAAMGAPSPGYTTETLTWDTSPLDWNVAGYLGEDCNSTTPVQQCQQFDYTPDGQLNTFESSDGSSPERQYQYDGDGRPTQITSSAFSNPQEYSYDPDGNVSTSVDASNNSTAQNSATLTYHQYLDDTSERLDVASGTLNQTGLFSYSYRGDGLLKTEAINDGSLGGTIAHAGTTTLSYTYTPAGRFSGRSESGADVAPSPLPTTSASYYSGLGLVKQVAYPQTQLTSFAFSVENELVQLSDQQCLPWVLYYYTVRGESSGGQLCSGGGASPYTNYYANGLSLSTLGTWNDLMAVLLGSNAGEFTWTYGPDGRLKSQTGPHPIWTSTATITTTRTYDAENHLNVTTFESPAPSPSAWSYDQVTWGPDGHPAVIGTSRNGDALENERLHWSGAQLLFTTHDVNGSSTLDDVKVDTQGDILPGDTYSGLTFYDRGPGGMILGCHNYSGTSYSGFSSGGWLGTGLSPCTADLNPSNAKMPTSQVWAEGPYSSFTGEPRIGAGGTLGMYRADGFTDGYDTIQGVRSFDSTSGLWTTPDKYAGDAFDPASQKGYEWNSNNPIAYTDASGFDDLYLGFEPAMLPNIGPTYHAFAVLINDSGQTIQVYSFGPSLNSSGLTLNNGYSQQHFAEVANNLWWQAGCTGHCPWEGTLNRVYQHWPNNHYQYVALDYNSNTALSILLSMAGLSTSLPPGAPWLPGWGTCGGVGSANPACSFFPNTELENEEREAFENWDSFSDVMYAIYGGYDPWLYYCNDCINHFPGAPP